MCPLDKEELHDGHCLNLFREVTTACRMPQDHLCNVEVLSLQRTCTAAVAAHCLATRPGGRRSHGAQGSDDIAAVVGAASSAPSAPGRAAHSR